MMDPTIYPFGWPCPKCGSGLGYITLGLFSAHPVNVCGSCFRKGLLMLPSAEPYAPHTNKPQRGSVAAVETAVDAALSLSVPVGVTPDMVKPQLAVIWLLRSRPPSVGARIRWAWSLLRLLTCSK